MKKYLIISLVLFITVGCTATGQKILTEVIQQNCSKLSQAERIALRARINSSIKDIGAEWLGVKCATDK